MWYCKSKLEKKKSKLGENIRYLCKIKINLKAKKKCKENQKKAEWRNY